MSVDLFRFPRRQFGSVGRVLITVGGALNVL